MPSRGGRSGKLERHARLYFVLFRFLNDSSGRVGHVSHDAHGLVVSCHRLLLLIRARTVESTLQRVDHAGVVVIETLHLPPDWWKSVIILDLGVGVELVHARRIEGDVAARKGISELGVGILDEKMRLEDRLKPIVMPRDTFSGERVKRSRTFDLIDDP